MHCPQSYEAANELSEIAAVPHQIVGPREGKPAIGIVQDTLVGSYRLTKNNNQFTRREYMNLMMYNKNFEGLPKAAASAAAVPGGDRWTGHQVVSSLIPPINMDMGNKSFDDDPSPQNKVKIVEGQLLQGTLDKDIYSKAGKGIVHVSYNDYGPDTTVNMIDSLQLTVESFLVLNGFSVGISDMIADEKTRTQMEEVIQARKKEVSELNLQVHLDLFDNNTGKTNQNEFETRVFTSLNKATKESGEFGQQALAEENRLVAMVKAGSKGGPINIAQMIACVGQQNIEGKRIPYGFSDRTLPHYKKYDDGAEARGFIESSFIGGLSPQEFFFHAMSGREGLIDTAVKSVTGDTEIVVIENGVPKTVQIGPWIDAHLAATSDKVQHFEERQMEYLELATTTSIPTVDVSGCVTWGDIKAITRHDPGTQLYQIRTSGGKSVTVTESQSLLVYDTSSKTFQPMLTPNVKLGNFVPVTMNLPAPAAIIQAIQLESYLPKTEFLYGTDFVKATEEMALQIKGRTQIPRGWWDKNNGSLFTLPYKNKALLQRATVRSNMANIKAGYVYPFTTNRDYSLIPDSFILDQYNGLFLGLFLAEGNVDITSGYVQITNNDSAIRQFVKDWFAAQNIKYTENTKTNHIGGTTSDIRGFSTILAQFLTHLVGHGAANKFIPSQVFAASDECIVGVLNGYFSGDGSVTENSVEAGSASAKLTDGISMLCTRLGIFGKVFQTKVKSNNLNTENILPSNRIAIRAQWASIFAKKIPLIDSAKQEKLLKMVASNSHRNFVSQNDVVLDEIIEINLVDVCKYPKVYDLTVPSTLNFGLANGLQVRDTADTGYIQRQLIKAMEDLCVQYDGTVRDANMNIVQFHYGEDGLNSTKIEGTGISYVKMSEADVKRDYGLAGVDFTQVLQDGLADDFSGSNEVKEYVEQVLDDRTLIVEKVFALSTRQGGVFGPLNPERLIMNIKVRFGLDSKAKTDLTPIYVIESLKKLMDRTQPYYKLWCALVRFHFAPHKLIVKERFTKAAFDALMELCIVKDWKAWSLPGELVGIIAAQSIGEPSTQMSSTYSTRIAVRNAKTRELFVGPIGKLIDTILETCKENTIQIAENSVVLDLNMENGYEIIGVSNDEKTSWKKISQVSRHPANGGLVEITTKSGRKTTATLTHSFLTRGPNGVIPILGSDLKVGTRVPIARQIPEVAAPLYSVTEGAIAFELTKEFGWLCGIYLADGSLNGNTVNICKIHPIVEENIRKLGAHYNWDITVRNYNGAYGPSKNTIIYCKDLKQFLYKHFSTGSYEKNITAPIFQSNIAFIQGIISGYFDGDGNVNVERQQIRVGSRSKTLIHDIAALLSYCGIFGAFGEETSVRIPDKVLYTYQILKKYAAHFRTAIGLHLNEKAAGLDAIVDYMERDGKHDTKEIYDKIPELGETIATLGRLLTMPGQSRNFGRWAKKESIGRLTLQGYIEDFEEVLATRTLDTVTDTLVRDHIETLRSAAYSDIVWDEIIELQILEDPKEFVYDFTVPGNDSFMVDDNILVHNTLNTFHLAGVAAKSNVTRGVPRLKELLKVTENPKAISLTVYLKPEFRENKDKVREVAQDLELTLLRDIVVKAGVYYDPNDESTLVGEDSDLIKFYKLFENREEGGDTATTENPENEGEEKETSWSRWLLRLELDRERMFNRNISMDDISYILNDKFSQNIHLVYSDFNAKKMIMRIRLSSDEKALGYADDLAGLKKFQNRLLNGIVIRGVPGIRAATFRKHADLLQNVDGEYKAIEQYVIDTDGSNFLEVMNHPAVDGSHLYSTHVHDVYSNLGVEATRATLLSELTGLFEEAGVNYRHLGLLCDVMTKNGKLMSVDRYGINKLDNGPLAKASFEETEKILLKAALFGEVDPITGVSANIMTGQPIRGGTSFAQILLDENALGRLLQGLPPTEDGDLEEEEGEELTQDMIDAEMHEDENDACATTQLRMNITAPADISLIDEPDIEMMVLSE